MKSKIRRSKSVQDKRKIWWNQQCARQLTKIAGVPLEKKLSFEERIEQFKRTVMRHYYPIKKEIENYKLRKFHGTFRKDKRHKTQNSGVTEHSGVTQWRPDFTPSGPFRRAERRAQGRRAEGGSLRLVRSEAEPRRRGRGPCQPSFCPNARLSAARRA